MGRRSSPATRGREEALAGSISPSNLVLLGEFGRAHGLKGEVRLKSHTADPLAVASYGPLVGKDGRTIVLAAVRHASGEAPDMLIARVEGVTTREGAEALNRMRLSLPRERLGETEEDEFFLADLVGLEARDPTGAPVGRIVGVPNYGGGDLLEIAPEGGGQTLLVPFTKSCVPAVEIQAGRVVVDLPVEVGAVRSGTSSASDGDGS